MRFIKTTLLAIAALVIAVFAVNNKQLVEISLYPFPVEFSVAAFILFFTAFALGILLGGGLQTFRVIYWKRVAKSAKKRADNLENDFRENQIPKSQNSILSTWKSE